MNNNYIEQVMELDTSKYIKTFEEIIKNIEKEFIHNGILVEDGIKNSNYLCTDSKFNITR